VLVEASGRGNYKLYLTEDRATVRAVVAGRKKKRAPGAPSAPITPAIGVSEIGMSSPVPEMWPPLDIGPIGCGNQRRPAELPPLPAVDLSALLADTDRAIQRVQGLLKTTAGGGQGDEARRQHRSAR
jgi:hypothetical protein